INVIGGLAVGIAQRGMSFGDALQRYTLLTVGDGLVTQIPALLISTATGVIITRAASEGNMAVDVGRQLFSDPKVLAMAAAVLFLFGLVPGLPLLPFVLLAAAFSALAFSTARGLTAKRKKEEEQVREKEEKESRAPQDFTELLRVDPIELEIGYGLIPLVDAQQGGELLERITLVRRQVALDLGLIVPPVRIRDNIQLSPNAYVIKVKGIEVGRGELMPTHYLAMNAGSVTGRIEGIPTREPAFGLAALWVAEEKR